MKKAREKEKEPPGAGRRAEQHDDREPEQQRDGERQKPADQGVAF